MQGTPSVLCSDVCKAMQSRELQRWCMQEGVTQEYSPPYHHASIGFVERFNQTLLNRLHRMWAEEPRYLQGWSRGEWKFTMTHLSLHPRRAKRRPVLLCSVRQTSCGTVRRQCGDGCISTHANNVRRPIIGPRGGVSSRHSE